MGQLAGLDEAAGGNRACGRLCAGGNVCGELCQSGSIRLGFENFSLKFTKILQYMVRRKLGERDVVVLL